MCMVGIFTLHEWLICMVNVGTYYNTYGILRAFYLVFGYRVISNYVSPLEILRGYMAILIRHEIMIPINRAVVHGMSCQGCLTPVFHL